MSILSKIGGFFEGIGSIPGDVLKGVEAAWNAVRTVWSWLTSISGILTDAWTWVVNGTKWFADQVGDWAGEVFHTLWDTLTSTIPKAIAWVFNQAVHWAAGAISTAKHELHVFVEDIRRWLVKLIHDLVNAVKGLLSQFIRWATAPIRWVLHWGAWLIHLITHPENLAKWVASSILEPVAEWFLKEGSSVIMWAIRKSSTLTTEFAHVLEDAIDKVF